jgi:type 1 glutamine amidotransferase
MRPILQTLTRGIAAVLASGTAVIAQTPPAPAPPPIKVLLVAGGCSHDYETRAKILVQGIRERIVRPMEWVVRLDGVGESGAKMALFESADWAKGYDLVVHDHCFPRVRDPAYVDRVLAPHRAGTPAVLIHGTMMSFRTGDERWFEFTGATIREHEREGPVLVEPLRPADPILKGFIPWNIPREELYRVERLASAAIPLAAALPPTANGPPPTAQPVLWTHRFGPAGTRVFASTLGNQSATLADPVSLDLLARGLLWSLAIPENGAFRIVPPGESLKGLSIPPIVEPLLRPGRNVTWQGRATGFQWGQVNSGEGAALGHDGDPETAWAPSGKGPGSWEVRWEGGQRLSLAAVWWKSPIPPDAVLEGTEDGRSWIRLATLAAPERPDSPVLVRFAPRSLTGLRLSVPRTTPGQGFTLREVAAYASEEELPSAILAATPDPPGLLRLRTAGVGDLARIRLAPGWQVEAFASTKLRGTPGQLLPTASGDLFLSVFPAEGGTGRVHRIQWNPDQGGLESAPAPYLAGLAPETRIAWDGEWLYTLSGFRLERVRKALGSGPADERQRFAALARPSGEDGPAGFHWTDLRLAGDGWLLGSYRTTVPGSVVRSDGRAIRLEPAGVLRFRRDGSGFAPAEDETHSRSIAGLAEIEGLLVWERSGDRIWWVSSGTGGLDLGCLRAANAAVSPAIELDAVPTVRLPALLQGTPGEPAGIELALELARRRGSSIREVERLLAEIPSPGLAGPLVAVIAALPLGKARPRLIGLATDPGGSPAVRAAAFRALGDFEGDLDPEVFRDLGIVTDPEVTAAIFEGLRRRRTTLPGAEVVALRLAHHPDPPLARAAFAFLRDREAFDAAFAALDTPERREDWPRAFDLLAGSPTPAVVEGILERLAATSDPDLRRGWLATLSRLRTLPGGTGWGMTGVIEARLLQALGDDRVDRVALLETISGDSLSLNDPEMLFTLAREVPGIEPWVVGRLAEAGPVLPARVSDWLLALAKDPDHDDELRRRAGALVPSKTAPPALAPAPPEAPASAPLDPRERFRREGCAACHNLDGEGPSAGPDLVAWFSALPVADRLAKWQNPAPSGWIRLETGDGRLWSGWIEVRRDDDSLDLVDRAGNRFQLSGDRLTGDSKPLDVSLSPCRAVSRWTPEDQQALLEVPTLDPVR